MSKDKYQDLVGHPGVRVRVERVDGNPPIPWSPGVWWDRELIAFLVASSPYMDALRGAEDKLKNALEELDLWRRSFGTTLAVEVVMFHGTFLKVMIWCPTGTATKLGIRGYTT